MAAKLKTIYVYYMCHDGYGEGDYFFELVDGKLNYITGWSSNDANWRQEYMGGLLKHVGVDVKRLPGVYEGSALKIIKGVYGY